jgi:hypothetical protein
MPAVPLSRSLLVAALLVAATAGLVAAELARACVCGDGDARRALERGAVGLVGRVASKSPVPRTPGLGLPGHRYVVRVTRAKGARIGGEVAVVGETTSPCGFEWRVGDRVGAFLGRIRGVWTTGGCGLVSPVELEIAMRPYPRPRGRGRVALLAGGNFGNARLAALDGGGRILGYGFGPGTVRRISVCPASRVAAELVDLDRRRSVVAVRSLRSLRVRSTARVPHSIRDLMCSDASGSIVYGTATDYGRRRLHGRVRVFQISGGRGTTIVHRPGRRALLGPGTAYVWAGRELIAISLPNGQARTVLPMGPQRLAAASPDGRWLAVHGFDNRLGLIDLATGEMSSRHTRSARVLRWLGSDRLLVRPLGGTQVYDTALRLERRYPQFDAFGQAAVGNRLFGTNSYRLIGLDLATGRQRTVTMLPDRRIADLTGVLGRPLLQAPRTPRPARRTARSTRSAPPGRPADRRARSSCARSPARPKSIIPAMGIPSLNGR